MATPISLLVCVAVAIVTLGVGLLDWMARRQHVEPPTLDESSARLQQIVATLEKLLEMNGQERRAACRTVAMAIRDDCEFLTYLLCQCYLDLEQHPININNNKEVKRLLRAAFRENPAGIVVCQPAAVSAALLAVAGQGLLRHLRCYVPALSVLVCLLPPAPGSIPRSLRGPVDTGGKYLKEILSTARRRVIRRRQGGGPVGVAL